MGGGCNIGVPSCLIGQAAQGPFSPRALSWIIGADLGWNPVTNLNFDLELMYQGTTQTAAPSSGFLFRHCLQHRRCRRRGLRARRLERQ